MLEMLKDILIFSLPGGFLGSLVGWLTTRRQRNNDFLARLQESIDLLSGKYAEALDENVRLQADNARLLANQRVMEEKIDMMSRKIDRLTRELKGIRHEKTSSGLDPAARGPAGRSVRNSEKSGRQAADLAAAEQPQRA